MPIVVKNNASNFLADGVNNSQTTIDLQSASSFPSLSAGEYFYGTIESVSGQVEIVKVTNVAGNTLTVVRAQEGTSAAPFVEGSRFELRITVGSVEDIARKPLIQRFTGDGATTVFTLSADTGNLGEANMTDAYINGVYQNKNTYTVSGGQVTFSEEPPFGAIIELMVR